MEASGTSFQELRDWDAAYELDLLETGALPPAVSEEPWVREYGND